MFLFSIVTVIIVGIVDIDSDNGLDTSIMNVYIVEVKDVS